METVSPRMDDGYQSLVHYIYHFKCNIWNENTYKIIFKICLKYNTDTVSFLQVVANYLALWVYLMVGSFCVYMVLETMLTLLLNKETYNVSEKVTKSIRVTLLVFLLCFSSCCSVIQYFQNAYYWTYRIYLNNFVVLLMYLLTVSYSLRNMKIILSLSLKQKNDCETCLYV